jgi:hypothetical protein
MHPIDPAAVQSAAQELFAEYGIQTFMEVQRRIMEANSKGDAQQAVFWQQVSRSLQSPTFRVIPR